MAIADSVIKERTLFGHPRGLTFLFTTEMCGAVFLLRDDRDSRPIT